MKIGLKMIVPLLLCLFLTSCIENHEIDKLGIINARGIDLADEEHLLETTLAFLQFSIQSEKTTNIISGKGKTIDGAMKDAEHTTIYKLAPGKIKLSVFGKELAEEGILPLLDNQARDARLPDLTYLAVSKTTAKEVLSADEKKISADIGHFLHGLIENHSTDHNVPRKTLQDFLRIYYDVGQDNVLPLFELEEGIPKLSGIALFRGDKMVAELTHDETILINLLDRTVKEQVIGFTLPVEPFKEHLENRENHKHEKEVDISFLMKKGKSKTKLVDKDNLIFETDTKLELNLLEQSAGIILSGSEAIKIIEEEVEKKLKARLEKFLAKLQSFESDPIGYGLYYRASQRGEKLTREVWREKFPTIEVKFNVDVDIIQHGVTE